LTGQRWMATPYHPRISRAHQTSALSL
jgi:hypothetical protein